MRATSWTDSRRECMAMRRTAVFFRGGLCVASMVLVAVLVVGLLGGRERPPTPDSPTALADASSPPEPIVVPTAPPRSFVRLDGVLVQPRDVESSAPGKLPSELTNAQDSRTVPSPVPDTMVVPASGWTPLGP